MPRLSRMLPAALLAAAAAWGAPSAAHAETKIAIVDMQRAVIETQAGAAAQAQLKKVFAARQTELEQKQKDLQNRKEAFDKKAKGGKVSQQQLQQEAEDLQKRYAEFQ